MSEPSYGEVYDSIQYQQYALILDDAAAFHYAREEIMAERVREQLPPEDDPRPLLPSYREYLQTDEWRARADAAKERAGNRCQLCNAAGPLEAHHRTYERRGKELPEDLVALCHDCHTGHHRWKRGAG